MGRLKEQFRHALYTSAVRRLRRAQISDIEGAVIDLCSTCPNISSFEVSQDHLTLFDVRIDRKGTGPGSSIAVRVTRHVYWNAEADAWDDPEVEDTTIPVLGWLPSDWPVESEIHLTVRRCSTSIDASNVDAKLNVDGLYRRWQKKDDFFQWSVTAYIEEDLHRGPRMPGRFVTEEGMAMLGTCPFRELQIENAGRPDPSDYFYYLRALSPNVRVIPGSGDELGPTPPDLELFVDEIIQHETSEDLIRCIRSFDHLELRMYAGPMIAECEEDFLTTHDIDYLLSSRRLGRVGR